MISSLFCHLSSKLILFQWYIIKSIQAIFKVYVTFKHQASWMMFARITLGKFLKAQVSPCISVPFEKKIWKESYNDHIEQYVRKKHTFPCKVLEAIVVPASPVSSNQYKAETKIAFAPRCGEHIVL